MNPTQTFESLAAVTWQSLSRAYRRRIHLGEDAISSYNLLTIDATLQNTVIVEDTRTNEATKGADFEFWIGHDSTGWFRYAIQAKRLSLSNNRYNSLNHKVNGIPQIDILERYAHNNRAAPIYCFYNFSSSIPPWQCCSNFVESTQFGCTVAPLSVARRALSIRGGKTFNWMHYSKRTLPWRCLVACPLHLDRSNACKNLLSSPDINSYYEPLPEEISVLRRTRSISDGLFDGYRNHLELRPRWIGIIELEGEVLI